MYLNVLWPSSHIVQPFIAIHAYMLLIWINGTLCVDNPHLLHCPTIYLGEGM